MPDDSIMDMVNNIESMYDDKNSLYRKWIRDGKDWDENAAHREARALAAHFAEAIETMPYFKGKYSQADFDQAAIEMIEEFKTEELPKWDMGRGAALGAVEGWAITHDGETIKTGFKDDGEAMKWLHDRHSYSVDHAVRHEGYDIVLVRDGVVKYSYKRDSLTHPTPVWPEFVNAYLEAAIWSSEHEGHPMDQSYTIRNFTQTAIDEAVNAANDFIVANREDLESVSTPSQHGHDFWLTRNRHGAGFWDRGYGEVGKRLTEAAHAAGEVNVIVGDDGKLHFE